MHAFEKIAVCHKTDIGLARKKNEDSYLIVDFPENAHATQGHGMIFAVADGLGGHPAGDVASDMACKGLLEYYAEKNEQIKDTASLQTVLNHLEEAVWKTHKKIMICADENKAYAGMGATLSALVLVGDSAFIAHVGDSRIYRLRHNLLERLTEDDTMAQISVEMGYLKPEEAATHPLRNALLQAVGQDIDEVHTRIENAKADDVFLLCSDGLHNMITDDEIKKILCNPVVQGACDGLIDAALKKGCTDNVTVIVVRILP